MKNIFIISVLLFFSGLLHAQGPDLSGIKICVNPGHGGHDSDDRFIAETGFWESEGNLTKGLYLRDILENCGATVIMSRVTNFTEDDLPLSQIDAIANDNNVDYFQSIHSNALNGSMNYPLLLFRGYDDDPVFPLAKVMAQLEWNELITNSNLYWPYGYDNIRGDWDFYPQWGSQVGLGVLRNLNMPGVLSEGSFHDYYPESWRLQNLDYRRCEAWNLADAIVNYFGEPAFTLGLVTGVARDPYKNTNYYWVPGSNDEKLPINEFTATLLSLNKVYQGDTLNNGVFFFDSIAPGSYSLIFEADGYFNDTVDISVTGGQTTIVDRWLPFDTTVAPVVLSHYMPSLPDSVGATESITFRFSSPMMTSSVETAFSITPAVNGQFSWDDDDKTLIFSHTETFEKATEYTVSLSAEAKSIWNVPIETAYSFNFITKNRNRLALLDSYPKNNSIVNPKLQFRLIFDAPLASSSLINNVILYNSNNDEISKWGAVVFEDEGRGNYFFLPQEDLNYNENYKIVLSPGILDEDGTPYYETTEINFSTQVENPMTFSLFDDFENIGTWTDPDDSQFTQGTDPSLTSFAISPYFKISGYSSGKLHYQFTETDGGICAETNSVPYEIGSGKSTEFGMWIFGDLSYNLLEYGFYRNSNMNEPIFIDTIDWAGWDLKYINKSEIPGDGNKQFHSIMVKQNPLSPSLKGEIFIDDIFQVPGVNIKNIDLNKDFYFIQNFPNPFEEITNFSYYLSVDADVKLEIFNLLGQKIVSIEKTAQKTGMQSIIWNGKDCKNNNVGSGTYFYKITAIPISNSSVQYQKSGVSVKY
ncbi:MAG: hypothetical protein DRI94_03820 [Bacteroidetes bacterium]|nr:MAG: hypothetical protein DRI94_03820 [Bacteroidota bacterium]